MKKTVLIFCATALFACINISANAQSEQEMKAWQEYMTPGDIHAMMAKWNGTWTEDITLWMQPGAPPTKTTSTCVNSMILGGRYQESRHTGDMMGMPFEGIGTTAWDNARKIFVSTWMDNMGTGIMYMEGTWDKNSKTINLKGKTTDPTTGKEMDIREVFTIIDDNTQKMEMFMTYEGNEFKNMEILFKRKK